MFVSLMLSAAMAADSKPLPVQSITAFKDGHALVIREGQRPVNDGEIRLDGLPSPLLGSFWPYAADEGLRVASATAGRWTTDDDRDVASIVELIKGNKGLLLSANVPVGSETEFVRGEIDSVLFGTHVSLTTEDDTTLVLPIDELQAVKITGDDLATKTESKTTHVGLTMKLDGEAGDSANVGLLYVQKGFRWIPQYRMTLGDDGHVEAVLRATLVNDLIDLDDASVNLVVGVPTFAFAGQTDPIALDANVQQAMQAVDNYRFDNGRRVLQSQIMSNSAGGYGGYAAPQREAAPNAEVTGGAKSEDLFVFTLDHVTLKKGERMSIEVARQKLSYEHVFEVDLPILPPSEISGNQQQNPQFVAAAKALAKPQVAHRLEISNSTDQPLTTAPVLLFTTTADGREQLLSQSLQTYTPVGGKSQIELGTAIDVAVEFDEEEVERVPNAVTRGRTEFDRVNLTGDILVCNHRSDDITLRIRRYVPGPLKEVSDDGSKKALAPYDQEAATAAGNAQNPYWWYGYRPNWYASLNPVSRAEWTLELKPEEEQTVDYEWHYFWRW